MVEVAILIMLLTSILTAFSQVLLKLSAKKRYNNVAKELMNPLALMGNAFLFISMIVNIYALKFLPYKIGPILTTSSYVFVMILGRLILKEPVTKGRIYGNMLIIIGICIFSSQL